jgi:hypothetical protein
MESYYNKRIMTMTDMKKQFIICIWPLCYIIFMSHKYFLYCKINKNVNKMSIKPKSKDKEREREREMCVLLRVYRRNLYAITSSCRLHTLTRIIPSSIIYTKVSLKQKITEKDKCHHPILIMHAIRIFLSHICTYCNELQFYSCTYYDLYL